MDDPRLYNRNVLAQDVLLSPDDLKASLPAGDRAQAAVLEGRRTIERLLDREDPRLLVIVGPCSIHDPAAALEYAQRLRALSREVGDTLFLVMRVYFEKPRTSTGWKGLINDPHMNDSFDLAEGLSIARRLLLELAALGLPCATEALDPITPQYLGDLVSWSAIGARTTESQTHREMASGLSTPVGIKNGTDGSLQVALNALKAVSTPHAFLGINPKGQVSVIRTRGNRYAHVILRGGSRGPNYDTVTVALVERDLRMLGLAPNIMIDCSHANSNKDPSLQPLVLKDIAHQLIEGNTSIIGVMLESHLVEGNQPVPADLSQLRYGVSVTDPCMGWEVTERLLRDVRASLGPALAKRARNRPAPP